MIDLEFIKVQTGSQLVEEDNNRLLLTWDEIEDEVLCIELINGLDTNVFYNVNFGD